MPCFAPSSSSSSEEDRDSRSRSSRSGSDSKRTRRHRMSYDDFDYAPRGRKFLDDYDLPPRVLRRFQQRRRMMRRRPMLDEYYDYDMDYALPLRPLQRKKGGRLAQAAPQQVALALDDRLWPVNYEMQQLGANKAPGGYDADALPEMTVTNDANVHTQTLPAMPMPPPVVDSGVSSDMQSLQSLSALPAAPDALPASYTAGPMSPTMSFNSLGAPPAETYAQAPYYGAPAPK
ncbi:hypothetical protein PENTCL1PPCAC_28545, partial [Pristionchus entomophagus]